MPIYRLIDEIVFPPPDDAQEDGLLAVGGDLSPKRLLLGYQLGIFPWYSDGQPILWWSPDPRSVFEPKNFRIPKALRQTLKKGVFQVTFDQAFERVIQHCGEVPRKGQQGTWITSEMRDAYIALHKLGFAHSVESWFEGELAGGLYGVSLGKCFFGESMFFHKTDASKVAFSTLLERLKAWGFHMVDAQMTTQHLVSLGAKEIPRSDFIQRLEEALCFPTLEGPWDGTKDLHVAQ